MNRILLIDDEEDLCFILAQALSREGYEVLTATEAKRGRELLDASIDLIILDIMMLEGDFSIFKSLREESRVPIIFLTSKLDERDNIRALSLGGDDYINKPFSLEELYDMVAKYLKNGRQERDYSNLIELDNLRIDLDRRKVFLKKKELDLSQREFDILELLLLNPNQIFSKEQIYRRVVEIDEELDLSAITEDLKSLRAKLQDRDFIRDEWGIGYRWES